MSVMETRCFRWSWNWMHLKLPITDWPCHGSSRFVTGLSPRRSMFVPADVHRSFLVDRVSLWGGFLRAFGFSSVSILPPMLHNHVILILFVPEEQACNFWEPWKKKARLCLFSGSMGQTGTFTLFLWLILAFIWGCRWDHGTWQNGRRCNWSRLFYQSYISGLVVSMLVSGTRVRGFEPGWSHWIFRVSE